MTGRPWGAVRPPAPFYATHKLQASKHKRTNVHDSSAAVTVSLLLGRSARRQAAQLPADAAATAARRRRSCAGAAAQAEPRRAAGAAGMSPAVLLCFDCCLPGCKKRQPVLLSARARFKAVYLVHRSQR